MAGERNFGILAFADHLHAPKPYNTLGEMENPRKHNGASLKWIFIQMISIQWLLILNDLSRNVFSLSSWC